MGGFVNSDSLTPFDLKFQNLDHRVLGRGTYGSVYDFDADGMDGRSGNWVIKIYDQANAKGAKRFLKDETLAERSARVINSLKINKDAGFEAYAIGEKNEILLMPKLEYYKENLYSSSDYDNLHKELYENNYRIFLDENAENIAYFDETQVLPDVDQMITANANESFDNSIYSNRFYTGFLESNGKQRFNMLLEFVTTS